MHSRAKSPARGRTLFPIVAVAWVASAAGASRVFAVDLSNGVLACGGDEMSGSAYRLQGTTGQAAVGIGTVVGYKQFSSGWWYIEAPALVVGTNEEHPNDKVTLGMPNPNPGRGHISLALHLPRAAAVQLIVHDVAGHHVHSTTIRVMEAGSHVVSWDGIGALGRKLPSGVYFLTVVVDGRLAERRRVLIVR